MLSHNESLNKFQRTEIIQNMFFSHNGTKLEISNKKDTKRCPNSCKLNNALINDPWVKEEIRLELYLEVNDNEKDLSKFVKFN